MATFIWVSSAAVPECKRIGFNPQEGKGENAFYIEFYDNPFDPTSNMHRVPATLVAEVTLRATTKSSIPLGLYAIDAKTEMRVSEHMVMRRYNQGMLPIERRVPSDTHQEVAIRAPTIALAKHIFVQATGGAIRRNPNVNADLIAAFDL